MKKKKKSLNPKLIQRLVAEDLKSSTTEDGGGSADSISLVISEEIQTPLFSHGGSQVPRMAIPIILVGSGRRRHRARQLSGPGAAPKRGGHRSRRPRQDHSHGPASPPVRRQYPPRSSHGLHQPRARARNHHRIQGRSNLTRCELSWIVVAVNVVVDRAFMSFSLI